uniref:Elongator complex protein 4 n=1 Tax=Accipiter nisus TaxID=211598 RepID=A0A8B9RXM4_9AVES
IMPNMTAFEKHQLIDTLSKLINILSIKTININTVLLNEQSPFALNHDFGNQLIFMGNLVREIEDKYGLYSNLLFKYFLAEGVVCGHDLFVASAKEHPDNILKELPAPLLDDTYRNERGEEATAVKSEDFQDSMKIAWRYQNLPKVEGNHIISSILLLWSLLCHSEPSPK